MEKRPFTRTEKIALVVIAALMAVVAVAGAVLIVRNVHQANELSAATEHTTVEYTLPETEPDTTTADETEHIADDKTSSKTSKSEASEKSSTTSVSKKSSSASKSTKTSAASSKTSSKASSKTSSKTSSDSSSKISKVTPATSATHASKKVCTINGQKCYVGDTITVALNLKTPVVLINYQGELSFDSDKLEYVEAKSASGGMVNLYDTETIRYNASVLSGLDFTSGGTVLTAKFKVKDEGSAAIENTFQVLSDMDLEAVPVDKCTQTIEIYD